MTAGRSRPADLSRTPSRDRAPRGPGPLAAVGLALDDEDSVQSAVTWRRGESLPLPSVREMLGPGRPLTNLTLRIDAAAAGMGDGHGGGRGAGAGAGSGVGGGAGADVRRFHVTGLVLHLVTAVAAFAFLLRLARRAGHPRGAVVALAATALFALHPIQVESVAYVSQRAEVLSALLYLVTLLLLDAAAGAWGRLVGGGAGAGRGGATAWWRVLPPWLGGVATWIVAMGAKATAISLPGAFVAEQVVVGAGGEAAGGAARDARDTRRETPLRRAGRALLVAAPILALAAWSAQLQLSTFDAHPEGGAGFTAVPMSPWQYFLTQLRVQWLYLRLLAWPSGFAFDRTFEASRGIDLEVAAAGLGVAALVGFALWLWWRAGGAAARLAAFGILFWFIALSPTSSFVPVADLAVEHRVYLAALGPLLAAVVGLDAALQRWLAPRASWGRRAHRIVAGALSLAVVAGLGLSLRARAEVWRSPDSLLQDALATSPDSGRILFNLGMEARRRGDLPAMEGYLRRACTVTRDPTAVVDMARNLGAYYVETGRPADGLAVLDRGLALAPDDPLLRSNRAVVLGMLGRNEEALADARRAARLGPGRPEARSMLGVALCAAGRCDEARAEFLAAEALDPGNPSLPLTAATVLGMSGRRDDACAAFRRARALARGARFPPDAAARAASLGCPVE